MGWDYCEAWPTKADMVKYLTGGEGDDRSGLFPTWPVKVLARCCKGETLWAVFEYTDRIPASSYAPERKPGDRFLCLFLLGKTTIRGRVAWGYKDMGEESGPYYYNVPLEYLDMVPDPGGYATAWREEVRKRHAQGALL